MQKPRDDRDLTDDRVDPHVDIKQRVVASTVDLCVENKARVTTFDIGFLKVCIYLL